MSRANEQIRMDIHFPKWRAGGAIQDIMAWVKRLEQDGTFLEFPDLFLWASQKGYDLKVLVWKEGLRVVDIVGGVGCSLFWSILIKFGYRRVRNKVGPCINRWGFHIRIIRCANLMDNPIPYHPWDWYIYLPMEWLFFVGRCIRYIYQSHECYGRLEVMSMFGSFRSIWKLMDDYIYN